MRPIYTREQRITAFWNKVQKLESGCWEWKAARNRSGYGDFNTRSGSNLAHRFSWELTHGSVVDDLMVLHKCDNPACVNPDHLFLGNQTVNMGDAKTKGRMPKGDAHWTKREPEKTPQGERNGQAKLTAETVREMRRLRGELKLSTSELGRMFAVSQQTASDITSRKRWVHIA